MRRGDIGIVVVGDAVALPMMTLCEDGYCVSGLERYERPRLRNGVAYLITYARMRKPASLSVDEVSKLSRAFELMVKLRCTWKRQPIRQPRNSGSLVLCPIKLSQRHDDDGPSGPRLMASHDVTNLSFNLHYFLETTVRCWINQESQ